MQPHAWRRPKACGESGCPEVTVDGSGNVFIRDSCDPAELVMFSEDSWEALKQAIKNGEYD